MAFFFLNKNRNALICICRLKRLNVGKHELSELFYKEI